MSKKSFKLSEISDFLGGQLVGDGSKTVTEIKTLSEADKGSISFIYSKKFRKDLEVTSASAVLISKEYTENCHVDYILVKNWDKYSDIPLKEFTQEVYKILEKNIHIMPEYLQRRLPHMIADDWLVGYGTKEGLEFTFSRMKLRTNFPRFFENAVDSLMKDYQLYEDDFNLFFPDIIDAVKNWKHRSE